MTQYQGFQESERAIAPNHHLLQTLVTLSRSASNCLLLADLPGGRELIDFWMSRGRHYGR
ncbi:hypothetical protein [Thermoleptolyngbya sp. C42_A2020_037]|uniref:hypothetical protein n=1 Tax=Thermoleptolyngbya sp. C42_A2020_037 TaxID=2747799 RepID=UPI001A08750D|nr:hypothetical protein [Thermoleptolyngbya sp. C42_A2020_037]MBF2083612.1 hypothetical protein [Thermoleptolyngbya sp. C42_A2020_037]